MQKALNAIYGGVAFLQDDKNRDASVKLIAEIDEIPDAIAAADSTATSRSSRPTAPSPRTGWSAR